MRTLDGNAPSVLTAGADASRRPRLSQGFRVSLQHVFHYDRVAQFKYSHLDSTNLQVLTKPCWLHPILTDLTSR